MISECSLTVKKTGRRTGTVQTKGSRTRERMVGAAERVMRSKGLAHATTREIAREAGYSEGAIYKHFESKEELFICVLTGRLPPFADILGRLPRRAGCESVGAVLEEVASVALAFYGESFPMSVSVFSEPGLLTRHREEMERRGAGPQKANEALVAYLEAERDLGRVRDDADPEAAAAMLLGACFQRAFLASFSGEDVIPTREEGFVAGIARTLARSLSPDGGY
jgi:AcrR family transcriptional regulator